MTENNLKDFDLSGKLIISKGVITKDIWDNLFIYKEKMLTSDMQNMLKDKITNDVKIAENELLRKISAKIIENNGESTQDVKMTLSNLVNLKNGDIL